MISDKLNSTNGPTTQSKNRDFYGIEILSGPAIDLTAIDQVKVWSLYNETQSQMSFIELNAKSVKDAKTLVIEFDSQASRPQIQASDRRHITGASIAQSLKPFDDARRIEVLEDSTPLHVTIAIK